MGCPARERVLWVFRKPHVESDVGQAPVVERGPFGVKTWAPVDVFVCIYCGRETRRYDADW